MVCGQVSKKTGGLGSSFVAKSLYCAIIFFLIFTWIAYVISSNDDLRDRIGLLGWLI